ncbi:hypothetical protein LTR94_034974, partial [Friedmanniomyces endolithicus]
RRCRRGESGDGLARAAAGAGARRIDEGAGARAVGGGGGAHAERDVPDGVGGVGVRPGARPVRGAARVPVRAR